MKDFKESPQLLVIGASVRAAAFSALRAGLRPWCADLFADLDLERVCPVARLPTRKYPEGFLPLLNDAPLLPWVYTGALENWPTLVRVMSQLRPLWGNDSKVIRRVRKPENLLSCLDRAGLPCPRVLPATASPPSDGSWLVKPLAGAGGRGIRFWSDRNVSMPRDGSYFQEFVAGEPCAAVYVGDGATAKLLGVTRQLIGETWLHAAPFHYCGSLGPLPLPMQLDTAFGRLGDALAKAFGLRGLFGVDSVIRDGVPYPVEVNPRYTASVEVLEHATGIAAMGLHCQAFTEWRPGVTPTGSAAGSRSVTRVGKAILFARDTLIVPTGAPWLEDLNHAFTEFRSFGDIPRPGQRIEKGHPILTVFARGASMNCCLDELRERVLSLDRWLFGR